jgi:hypothetical protein
LEIKEYNVSKSRILKRRQAIPYNEEKGILYPNHTKGRNLWIYKILEINDKTLYCMSKDAVKKLSSVQRVFLYVPMILA